MADRALNSSADVMAAWRDDAADDVKEESAALFGPDSEDNGDRLTPAKRELINFWVSDCQRSLCPGFRGLGRDAPLWFHP